MAKKTKKIQEPPTLWEGWPKPPENPPVFEGPLIPPRRHNPWPYIVPLFLIVVMLVAGFWAYQEYLAPKYAAQESAYSKALATAEQYEGEVVKKKEQKPDCFSLAFDRKDTIHTLCVSEELWNEQTEGEPFDLSLLRAGEGDKSIKLPW